MPLNPGTRLGAYEIVAPIGTGGMGEVYRAHDPRIGRDVAIKVLPASLSRDPASLARFEREARAIGALSHPNVVNIFDTGCDAGVTFVVMELLEGETLRARLQNTSVMTPVPAAGSGAAVKGRGLPRKKALEIGAHIAQGLAAAHARGIVHRDLKPENVFLTSDGRVKVLDFGLARSLPGAMQAGADAQTVMSPNAASDSVPGLVLGTVGYMAPEQVRGQLVDHRADIFAFGAVLYEMLTGERAFDGESPIETMSAILKADPLDQASATVALSGPIEPLLRHCLEKQPDERFQSARDLAFQLQAIGSGSMSTGAAERAIDGDRRGARRLLLTAAVALIALAAGIAIGAIAQRRPANDTAITLAAPMPPGVTMFPGISPARAGGLAVSADGRRIAFVGAAGNTRHLFVRGLDDTAAHLVAGTEGAAFPCWSPDGRRLAFIKDRTLRQVSVDGGDAPVITEAVNARSAAAWGPDDTLLFHGDYRLALMRVPAHGGTPVDVLPRLAAKVSWFSPLWLPDGRHFLVVRFAYADAAPDGAGIYQGSVDSKELNLVVAGRISEVALGATDLFYRRGTDLLAQPFDARAMRLSGEPRVLSTHVSMIAAGGPTVAYFDPPGGLSQGHRLTWFARDGRELARLGEEGTFRDPRISPDGKSVAVARAGENGLFSIYAYDVNRNIDTRVTPAGFVQPSWSADGTSIIVGGDGGVVRVDSAGGQNPQPVHAMTAFSNVADATPDGREILIRVIDSNSAYFASLPLDGKSEPRPITPVDTIGAGQAALSSDGKWLAFVMTQEGKPRLYAQPYGEHGRRTPITGMPARYPRWRRDGGELYFLTTAADNRDTVMAVSVTKSGAGLDLGEPHALFTVDRLVKSNGAYDVTADGQKFVMVIGNDPDPSPVTLRIRTSLR